MWAAITARLTRACWRRPGPTEYLQAGGYVRDHLIAGYFFPRLPGTEPFFPRYESGQWSYGDLSEAQFEAMFVRSLGATAIGTWGWTAEEGTLHEVEYLLPQAATGRAAGQPVLLQGYLYLDQDRLTAPPALAGLDDGRVLDLLHELFVGAEQGYGWGRLIREGNWAATCQVSTDRPAPADASTVLRAHVPLDAGRARPFYGLAEPLVGREWASGQRGGDRYGPGQDLTGAVVAWIPGSRIVGDGTSIRLGPFGMWEV